MKCASATAEAFGEAWYCARTQPKHEHIAAANVTKQLGLEVFHPRLRLERATRRGVVRVIEPLFPCYLFVRCRLDEHIDQIRYVSGISSLVHFGGRIPVVPDPIIEDLQSCFDSQESLTVRDDLQPGMEVSVAQGSFLGAHGVVVRTLAPKQRVQILLDFLGRPTLAEVDRNCLTVENRSVADLMPALAIQSRMDFAVAG